MNPYLTSTLRKVLCVGSSRSTCIGPRRFTAVSYARYWCHTKGCPDKVGISRQELERCFLALLDQLEPTADAMVNVLPAMAKTRWKERIDRLRNHKKALETRHAERKELRTKLIEARVKGELAEADFQDLKAALNRELADIERQMGLLEAEHITLDKMTADTERLYFNLKETWQQAGLPQKQAIQTELFPDGLLFSNRLLFFEPRKQRTARDDKRYNR